MYLIIKDHKAGTVRVEPDEGDFYKRLFSRSLPRGFVGRVYLKETAEATNPGGPNRDHP